MDQKKRNEKFSRKKEEKKNLHTAFRLLFLLEEETLENLLFSLWFSFIYLITVFDEGGLFKRRISE